ncbi:hypothetical protein I6B53_09735 [Schaalia sp. 19OD2882]|uniref:hypothetical protein n=1 Tax=Schaalia sp. 19OD2882 TaxID=2794089 RepID=UPI001C1EFEA1|nr:hypothetical protein [Schaalia sp. 19OD2882]QWW19360.1 hypothetical protein I6B53_09735 [Schaalia sp. 19OD2882]
MTLLAVALAFAALVIVVHTVFQLAHLALISTGHPWYMAQLRARSAQHLTQLGHRPEAFTQRLRRHVMSTFNVPFSAADREYRLRERIAGLHRQVSAHPPEVARQEWMQATGALARLTGHEVPAGIEEHVRQEVAAAMAAHPGQLSGAAAPTSTDLDILARLRMRTGQVAWLLRRPSVEARPPLAFVLGPLADLLDHAGRGTTVGLFIGLSMALALKDPLATPVAAVPLVGTLAGALGYSLRLAVVLEPERPWRAAAKALAWLVLALVLFTFLAWRLMSGAPLS